MGAVDEYLSTVTDEADLASLPRIYAIARDLAPDAEQGTGYRMPALKLRGKALISAIRTKTHIGVYPFSSAAVAAVAGAVTGIPGVEASTGSIRIDPGSEPPEALIRDLILFRISEIEGR